MKLNHQNESKCINISFAIQAWTEVTIKLLPGLVLLLKVAVQLGRFLSTFGGHRHDRLLPKAYEGGYLNSVGHLEIALLFANGLEGELLQVLLPPNPIGFVFSAHFHMEVECVRV